MGPLRKLKLARFSSCSRGRESATPRVFRHPPYRRLALTLMETCVKNCDYAVHEAAGQRVFLDAVVALAEASPDQATHEHALARTRGAQSL